MNNKLSQPPKEENGGSRSTIVSPFCNDIQIRRKEKHEQRGIIELGRLEYDLT